MRSNPSNKLRQDVAKRAEYCCEYCLMHQDDLVFKCQTDHIISLKHGGPTRSDNLAHSCLICNTNKGSDVGSVDLDTRTFARFFNPRTDRCSEHFDLQGAEILPKTDIGKATVKIFQFNTPERLARRSLLLAIGRYPGKSPF